MLSRTVKLVWISLSSRTEGFLGLLSTRKGGCILTMLVIAAIEQNAEHSIQGKEGTVVREAVTGWFQKRKASSQKAETERRKDR